jgi:hypothetical protein
MRLDYPGSDGDDYVDVDGTLVPVGDDGTVEVPEDAEGWVRSWCETNDYDYDAVVVEESATCDVVKTDGEVCGRERPCPYHSDQEA